MPLRIVNCHCVPGRSKGAGTCAGSPCGATDWMFASVMAFEAQAASQGATAPIPRKVRRFMYAS
jgi:hypothetical protein